MSASMGVDYGSMRTSFVFIGDESVRTRVTRYGKDWSHEQALADAHDQMERFIRAWSPWVIAVESPIVGASKNAQTAVKMSMMAGALLSAAGKGSGAVELVPPATWKKQVVGHGAASKDDVSAFLRRHHPHLYQQCHVSGRPDKIDQDLIDAACLALHAQR